MKQFAAKKELMLYHKSLNLARCLSVQWVDVTVNKGPVTTDNTDVHLSGD